VEAHHVGHGHLRDAGAEEVGPPQRAGERQQAAVRAADHGDAPLRRQALAHEIVAAGREVVEAVLLGQARAGLVPLLAELASAANVRECVEAVAVV